MKRSLDYFAEPVHRSSPQNRWLLGVALGGMLAWLAPPAFAFRLYTVGGDADCSFSDLQQAIDNATDSDGNSVLIARSGTYAGQHVVINGQTLSLLGGLDNCDSSTYSGQTTLNGTSGHSVIEIDGASQVYVANLDITGATLNSDQGGGGIVFLGAGSLELVNDTIEHNTAGWGGGLWFGGSGSLSLASDVTITYNTANPYEGGGINIGPSGPTTVTLGTDTLITYNTTAKNGGGIFIQGPTYLLSTAAGVWIFDNHADSGDGGGIFVGGPAQMDFGSTGLSGVLPAIQSNTAMYGGGLAAIGYGYDNQNAPVVRLFTTDPNNPVEIANNQASHTGGGIYLKPSTNSTSFDRLCASNFRIDDNVAQEGAAIYDDEDNVEGSFFSAGSIDLNTDDDCGSSTPIASLGAVACASGVACNEIDGNMAQDTSGQPTDGAAILIQSNGSLFADRFSMSGNQGGELMRFLSDSVLEDQLSNCLLVDNTTTGNLIEAAPGGGGGGLFTLDSCTIADNQIGLDYVMLAQIAGSTTLTLTNSIIDQGGHPTIDYQGPSGDLVTHYLLSNDVSTLIQDGTISGGTPTFVDEANADYHLQRTSLGVDYAPTGSTDLDLDGNPRSVDLDDIPNQFGPMDLGAYEIQTQGPPPSCSVADTIFCDGFDG